MRTRPSILPVFILAVASVAGCSSPDDEGLASKQNAADVDMVASEEQPLQDFSSNASGVNRLHGFENDNDLKLNPPSDSMPRAKTIGARGQKRRVARAMQSGSVAEIDMARSNSVDFVPRSAGSAPVAPPSQPPSANEPVRPEPPATSRTISGNRQKLIESPVNVEVFYATDRKSKSDLTQEDWWKIHWAALLSGLVYLLSFGAVFVSKRKILCGLIAVASLSAFLILGQSATLTWQTAKRLGDNGDVRYLSELSDSPATLEFGKCEVSIPADHQTGQIDQPSIIKLEFQEDPEKHMVLNRVIRSTKDEFYGELNDVLVQKNSDQTLVFIHGYNVSFENAVKRTAQICYDLKFDGAPICYSWSSHGSLANYTRDLANADATVVSLNQFLLELVERTGNSTVHLVAHSMGNRALLQALDRIAVARREDEKLFGQLVMAAPDVSAHEFRTRYATAAMKLANIVTLYASSNDRALLASTEFHGHNRAGLAGEHLIALPGIDTVDVSEIDTSFLGHSYYGNHPDLIRDLQAVVELSQPASKRRWLTQIFSPSGDVGYFRFADLRHASESKHRR